MLIGVDDAHLLDGFSAHVVHQLAQSREARLVVTVRSGAAEPDAITALWRDGLATRLDLDPLSAQATRAVVETILGGSLDSRSAQRFWRLTGGNALFVQQLVRDQLDAGRLERISGVWMWDGDVAMSQTMSALVGHRLDRLPAALAMVLDALSLCEPLDADVLTDLAGREAVEAAERMGLIRVERSASRLRATLAHPIFGEVRRASAGEMYLSRLRGRLARRLAEVTAGPVDEPQRAVVRAKLMVDSDLPPDPALLLTAARHAMRMLDIDLAERLAEAAACADPGAATRLQAYAMVLSGRGEDAEDFFAAGIPSDDAQRREWTLLRAANSIWMRGRPDAALPMLAELATAGETRAQRAGRLALEACLEVVAARCRSAEEKARRALDCDAEEPLSDIVAMMASVALVMATGALGHAADTSQVAYAAIARAADSFETAHLRFWFGGVYLRACRLNGLIGECQRATAMLSALASDAPGRSLANLLFLQGHSAMMRGDLPEAARLLHESLAAAERHGVTTVRPACYFALIETHAKLGESEQATAMLTQARSTVAAQYLFMQTALAVAAGWAQASAGALGAAVDTVLDAAAVARERDQPTHELACLQAATQWGAGERLAEVAARADELADELGLPLARAVAAHAGSLHAGDGEGLLAAGQAYQAIGDRCTAADAAAQAAVTLAAAQLRGRSLFAASMAAQLAEECGGLCTPATRSPVSPTPLTGRQREVAELVAAGLSNKEIAEALVTSVRTVEGHLYRACQRVGATSRSDLAAIMRAGPA